VTAHRWESSDTRLAWHVVFDHAPAVARYAERAASAFRDAGLLPVEPEWLHLTVADAGDPDAAAARLGRLEPLRLVLGPPRLLPTAVVLAAAPAGGLAELREALTGARDPAYDPHVALAYVEREADATTLVPLLQQLDPLPLELEVREVTMLRLRRPGRCYRWHVADRVPLGGRPA
jgi:2'-5' RNA ligase